MDYLKNYSIPIKGLKVGTHVFDFEVEKTFFEQFEHSEIKDGTFKVVVELEKGESFLALNFFITGKTTVECDRCLEPFDQEIESEDKIVIKFGDEIYDSRYIGEEVQIMSHNESEVNVAQYIYEFIHLHIPLKRVHPSDEDGHPTCNENVLEALEQHTVNEEQQEVDPRWDKLKDLLNN